MELNDWRGKNPGHKRTDPVTNGGYGALSEIIVVGGGSGTGCVGSKFGKIYWQIPP